MCFCEERSDSYIFFPDWWSEATGCFLLCFCGAKRPLYIFPRFCGVKRPVVFVMVLGFYYHKERSCGFKVFICM